MTFASAKAIITAPYPVYMAGFASRSYRSDAGLVFRGKELWGLKPNENAATGRVFEVFGSSTKPEF